MKKALVLVYSKLRHDARVKRQIGFLSENFEVTVAAFGDVSHANHHFIDLKPGSLGLLRKIMIAVWSLLGQYRRAWNTFHPYSGRLKNHNNHLWDIIISNDVETLPLAFQIKKKRPAARIILDAHEYAPRHFEDRWWWRLIFQPMNIWCCNEFIPRLDAMFTVGKGLADEYATHFGRQPVVITNAPGFQKVEPSKVQPNQIRLVHHGIANPSRKLELMFDVMQLLDQRFTLDLYLLTSDFASGSTKDYIHALKEKFRSDPRITLHEPVESNMIVQTIKQFDIGIFLLPPSNFNYANALPNKFFDFIQARLAVAIGPSPEMARYVHQYQNGIVSADFSPRALASQLNQLTTETLLNFKQGSEKAAADLCAEKNAVIFNQTISALF